VRLIRDELAVFVALVGLHFEAGNGVIAGIRLLGNKGCGKRRSDDGTQDQTGNLHENLLFRRLFGW
jgi:hypothetical protein